jgi:hypothetical protein
MNIVIIVIGDFRTFQRVVAFDKLHLECHETVFPNHTSLFEIECEHSDCDLAKQKIEAKLKELGVEFVPSPTGKLERLMELPDDTPGSSAFNEEAAKQWFYGHVVIGEWEIKQYRGRCSVLSDAAAGQMLAFTHSDSSLPISKYLRPSISTRFRCWRHRKAVVIIFDIG